MSLPQINYGDTFNAACLYQDLSNAPVNLTSASITVEAIITAPDGLTTVAPAAITVTLANQSSSPGQFAIASDTSLWENQIGDWSLLIRYESASGNKWSTQRIDFEVI